MSLPTAAQCIVDSSYTNLCSISNSEGNFKGFNTELCFPFAQSDNKYQPLVSLEIEVTVQLSSQYRTMIVNVSLPGYHYPLASLRMFQFQTSLLQNNFHSWNILLAEELFFVFIFQEFFTWECYLLEFVSTFFSLLT